MSEKKKLTTAEILAAARNTDSKGSSQPAKPAVESEQASDEHGAAVDPPAERAALVAADAGSEAPTEPPARPVKKPTQGMSVADILAMARAEKSKVDAGGKEKSAASAAGKPAAAGKSPAAAKSAAGRGASAAPPLSKEPDAPSAKPSSGRRISETASVLAAARQGPKSGPHSKAEDRAFSSPAPPRPLKEPSAVPPMPAKPAYARREVAAPRAAQEPTRRSLLARVLIGSFLAAGFASLATTMALWTLAFARFMFPNILREPPSRFKVGFPSDFPAGHVEEKYKAQFGVWVVHGEYAGQPQIYALKTVCTHLGCTPNWLEAENKFKCPCHGSGFYKDGINFEGPAPRPLERYAIQLADDGQLEIDKSRIFQEELGQWSDPMSFVPA
jgi:cytochrome b6-f complex iron-sulfur subunit